MRNWVVVVLASMGLCGCGGGGSGSVISTPTTPPPPPVPAAVNTTITDLKASQTFANDAAGMNLVLDLTTKTGVSGELRPKSMTVSYDAGSQSYSVSADGRSQTFAPSTIATTANGDTSYAVKGTPTSSYLDIVTKPYTQATSNKYVGMAFWQNVTVADTREDLSFYLTTYGLPTAASATPRTGTAGFTVDTFGAVSTPGQEPRQFSGSGQFDVDFAAGVFAVNTSNTETTLVTNKGVVGGGIDFFGSGRLSASDGSFSGSALYRGSFGAAAGGLAGRFYGPAADELGATFSGANSAGLTVVGGMTGQRAPSATVRNLTLTNMRNSQHFYVKYLDNRVGGFDWQNAETFMFGPPTSDMYGGQFTIADKVASSDPNFSEYRKTFSSSYDSQNVTVKLYKPGGANSELALTYSSFIVYSTTVPYGTGRAPVDLFGPYGLETPNGLLAGKTGTGTYDGVVYGVGQGSGARYDVKGTSHFVIDFAAQSLSGNLGMKGTARDGSGLIDFGTYDVAGRLTGTGNFGTVLRNGTQVGEIEPHLYGPDGEEIVAPFSLTAPAGAPGAGTNVTGIAAAKRP